MRDLLEVLKQQRTTFIRDYEGNKHLTNPELYYALEDEALEIQKAISRKQKKVLIEQGIYVKGKL